MNESLILTLAREQGLFLNWARPHSELEYLWETAVGLVRVGSHDGKQVLVVTPYDWDQYRALVSEQARAKLKDLGKVAYKGVNMTYVREHYNERRSVDEASESVVDETYAAYLWSS